MKQPVNPLKKNEILRLQAENAGADMEGVCRFDGIPVFVPGLLPGEEADVRIVKTESRYAYGRMESAPAVPSPQRRESDCPVYPRCGGCSCRHMSYEATLEAKRRQVEDCFSRIARIQTDVLPVLGAENPFHYRNKTTLPAGGTPENPILGFYAPRSHSVIPVQSCLNARKPADEIAAAFLSWMKTYAVPPYLESRRSGLIRHLMIRTSTRGESMVTIIARESQLPHTDALLKMLLPYNIVSLWLNENRRPDNVILGDRFTLLSGSASLTETLCGLTFELGPASFFQVFPEQTEKLYRTVADFAALSPEKTLCDVYCGVGTITLSLASRCASAIGIEIVPGAVENARRNALLNHLSNCTFHTGKAEEVLPRLVAGGLRPDVIVVDPPRKGLEPQVIRAISEAQPDRLVYVSCNPATLARDAGMLRENGYIVSRVQPVDMFCWTSGVETVVQLSKGNIQHKSIQIEFPLDDLDTSCLLNDATYKQIQEYVLDHTGLNVSCLYIAQVKAKHGIIERECYNKPKAEGNRVPKCPPDKEKAIEDALRYFQMIE